MYPLPPEFELYLEVVQLLLRDAKVLGLAAELAAVLLFLLKEGLDVLFVGDQLLEGHLMTFVEFGENPLQFLLLTVVQLVQEVSDGVH